MNHKSEERKDLEFKRDYEGKLLTFSNANNYAILSIKSLLIFNGGAIVGILTFLGDFIKNSHDAIDDCFMLIILSLIFF